VADPTDQPSADQPPADGAPLPGEPGSLRPAVPEGAAAAPPAAGTDHPPTGPDQTGPDQTRPDQTRPDQTRPDQTRPTRLAGLVRAVQAAGRAHRRAGRAAANWMGRPGGRFAVPGLLIAALLGVALSTGAFLVPTGGADRPGPPAPPVVGPSGIPLPTAPPGGVPPLNTPGSVPTGQGNPADALIGWAEQVQARTGIPEVALRAYGYAELAVRATTPTCQLSWTTLAAIGRVESNHGSSGGATLLGDGRALPPIFGLPLDGEGDRALILDTDGGTLDQDPIYDRAIGPMQFIPQTWQSEAVDATGDGIGDVHNLHDASLAAANYLCRGGRDLTTATGWWSAVLSYNPVQAYAEAVFAAANEYGRQSRAGGVTG
jgi:hypothetical protein